MTRGEFIGGLFASAVTGGCATAGGGFAGRGAADGILRIAHCGDPQLGMGLPMAPGDKPTPEGYRADLMRLEREIEILNGMELDLVYFTGDMTHVAEEVVRDWPRLLKKLKHRFTVSPGNHDMGNRLTAANADRFRSVFGCEYESFEMKGWRFIVGNSQYWRPTDEVKRRTAYEQWLDERLEDARAKREKVIIATHIPAYVSVHWESDTYENFPRSGRRAMLDRCIDSGVRFWLAGHTHTMLHRAWKSMTMLNAETTCRNFDERPFGFRLLTIAPDGSYTWEFQPIAERRCHN